MPIYRHIAGTKASAQFSECGKFRYTLTIDFEPAIGRKTVCAIMQNPSVACVEYADKSVQFLENLVFKKAYPEFAEARRLIVVNQFAYIQTDGFKGSAKHIGPENGKAIKAAINSSHSVLIAWGISNPYHDRQKTILEILRKSDSTEIYHTKKHPSRGFYQDFIARV